MSIPPSLSLFFQTVSAFAKLPLFNCRWASTTRGKKTCAKRKRNSRYERRIDIISIVLCFFVFFLGVCRQRKTKAGTFQERQRSVQISRGGKGGQKSRRRRKATTRYEELLTMAHQLLSDTHRIVHASWIGQQKMWGQQSPIHSPCAGTPLPFTTYLAFPSCLNCPYNYPFRVSLFFIALKGE